MESNFNLLGNLPKPSEVGYLSAEIAGEGLKIRMGEGGEETFSPPASRAVDPGESWKEIKSIKKYFHRTGYQVYPMWIYHPSEPARIVKNEEEAAKFGVKFRLATRDERARYGVQYTWDYLDGSQWRTHPHEDKPAFRPDEYANVKNVVRHGPSSVQQQNELINMLVPQVAAAVAQALKIAAPQAPASVNPADWDAFQEFLAWKKSAEAAEVVAAPVEEASTQDDEEAELNMWRAEAERLGVKVDKRWGLARIQSEIEKAA